MARPTIYSEEILKKTKEYVEECEDETEQETIGMSAKGTELFKNTVVVKLPTMEGLSYHLNVNKDTLVEWAKIHEEFSVAIDRLKAKQANALISNGLSGKYNPTIAKLLLSANHGMREKSDITTNDKDLPTPILGGTSHAIPTDNSNKEDTSA